MSAVICCAGPSLEGTLHSGNLEIYDEDIVIAVNKAALLLSANGYPYDWVVALDLWPAELPIPPMPIKGMLTTEGAIREGQWKRWKCALYDVRTIPGYFDGMGFSLSGAINLARAEADFVRLVGVDWAPNPAIVQESAERFEHERAEIEKLISSYKDHVFGLPL